MSATKDEIIDQTMINLRKWIIEPLVRGMSPYEMSKHIKDVDESYCKMIEQYWNIELSMKDTKPLSVHKIKEIVACSKWELNNIK